MYPLDHTVFCTVISLTTPLGDHDEMLGADDSPHPGRWVPDSPEIHQRQGAVRHGKSKATLNAGFSVTEAAIFPPEPMLITQCPRQGRTVAAVV